MYEESEKIILGGIPQWINIKTESLQNPILLCLHGGPGYPKISIPQILEKYFIIVSWDQRGSGKSFTFKIKKNSMRIDQFISDLYELAIYLSNKFKKKKIFLLGKSWGTIIGILSIHKFSNLFHGYVGISQVVDVVRGEEIMYQFALSNAIRNQNKKAITQLQKIGSPFKGMKKPYTNFYRHGLIDRMKVYKWVMRFGGVEYYRQTSKDSILYSLKSIIPRDFSIIKNLKFLIGFFYSIYSLNKEILKINMFTMVPKVKIPVFFFTGRHDINCPSNLIQEYFDMLKAPNKEMVWFEKSAHSPNSEEPEIFSEQLISKLIINTL